jgi:hypothetical protein
MTPKPTKEELEEGKKNVEKVKKLLEDAILDSKKIK